MCLHHRALKESAYPISPSQCPASLCCCYMHWRRLFWVSHSREMLLQAQGSLQFKWSGYLGDTGTVAPPPLWKIGEGPADDPQFSSVQSLSPVRLFVTPWTAARQHQLPEFTQTRVHRVGDAIQPSHPLSSPSPPAFNLSQQQGIFK